MKTFLAIVIIVLGLFAWRWFYFKSQEVNPVVEERQTIKTIEEWDGTESWNADSPAAKLK